MIDHKSLPDLRSCNIYCCPCRNGSQMGVILRGLPHQLVTLLLKLYFFLLVAKLVTVRMVFCANDHREWNLSHVPKWADCRSFLYSVDSQQVLYVFPLKDDVWHGVWTKADCVGSSVLLPKTVARMREGSEEAGRRGKPWKRGRGLVRLEDMREKADENAPCSSWNRSFWSSSIFLNAVKIM